MDKNVLQELYEVVISRKDNYQDGSYTCYLFSKGLDKILKKCGEECSETIIAAKNNDNDELANEISDLIYHLMVLCAEKNLLWSNVEKILDERSGTIGNLKQFHVTDKNT